MLFTPFSSIGLDETSIRRCKISLNILKQKSLIFNGSTIHIDSDKSFLKEYLSSGIWDSIEKLDIFILNYHDNLYGLLLIFNSEDSSNKAFNDYASYFTSKAAELFYNSKSRLINNLAPQKKPAPPCSSKDLKAALLENINIFSESDYDSGKYIFINYKLFLDDIKNRNRSIDTYRIEIDLLNMFSSMLFGSSFIINIIDNRLLIVFLSGLSSNNKIIENQMLSSVISLLDNKYIPASIKPEVVVNNLNCHFSEISEYIFNFLDSRL